MILEATPYVEKEIEINPWLSAAARFDASGESGWVLMKVFEKSCARQPSN